MKLQLVSDSLLVAFCKTITVDVLEVLNTERTEYQGVGYFEFYNAVSSVYSSKIEGEEIDFDSFYKYKFNNQKYQLDYTKRTEDLYKAYELIRSEPLNLDGVLSAHKLLTAHLLPESERGKLRNNAMFVLDGDDKIAYVAADAEIVIDETEKLFNDIKTLLKARLSTETVFYYAAMIHLVFVKIHPLQDGNGRIARLMEKWFLAEKLGDIAHSINLEKKYFKNLDAYYANLKVLGNQYGVIDYSRSLPFLLMTIKGVKVP